MDADKLSYIVIGSALRIHSELGPGLFESVYEIVLFRDLFSKNIEVERQVSVPVRFDGVVFDKAFVADLVVGRTVLVEIKSEPRITPVDFKQTLTYLRLLRLPLALILNFGAASMRDGIKRIINNPVRG